MDLLWIIENQISENSRNEHFRENIQIYWSNDIQIKWFGIIIREISYFQNQQNFRPKLGKIEEH